MALLSRAPSDSKPGPRGADLTGIGTHVWSNWFAATISSICPGRRRCWRPKASTVCCADGHVSASRATSARSRAGCWCSRRIASAALQLLADAAGAAGSMAELAELDLTQDRLLGGRLRLQQPRARLPGRDRPGAAGGGGAGRGRRAGARRRHRVRAPRHLCLAARVPACRIVGLERDPELLAIAPAQLRRQRLGDRIVLLDGRSARRRPRCSRARRSTIVMSNPPYHRAAAAPRRPGTATGRAAHLADSRARRLDRRLPGAAAAAAAAHPDPPRRSAGRDPGARCAGRAGDVVVYPLWPAADRRCRQARDRGRPQGRRAARSGWRAASCCTSRTAGSPRPPRPSCATARPAALAAARQPTDPTIDVPSPDCPAPRGRRAGHRSPRSGSPGVIGSVGLGGRGLTLAGAGAGARAAFGHKRAPAVALADQQPRRLAGAVGADRRPHPQPWPTRSSCRCWPSSRTWRPPGGYWLACAADEIFADPSSIVGSIGVVSAGFGFHEAIGRARHRAAGAHHRRAQGAARPVPRPSGAEDLGAAASEIQGEILARFVEHVRGRRGDRLQAARMPSCSTAGSGPATAALRQGLIDGLGEARATIRARFGKEAKPGGGQPEARLAVAPVAFPERGCAYGGRSRRGTRGAGPLAAVRALAAERRWECSS